MYLLDTNTCIYYLNGDYPALTRRFEAADADQIAVSTLTTGELHFGAARSGRPEANRERIQRFLAELEVLPFDRECGEHFGRLKAELLAKGRPIPAFDIGIAATAHAQGRVLVTSDSHMREVEGLPVEDWRQP